MDGEATGKEDDDISSFGMKSMVCFSGPRVYDLRVHLHASWGRAGVPV